MTQLTEKTTAGNKIANTSIAHLNPSPKQKRVWAARTNVVDRNRTNIRWCSATCQMGELAGSNLQTYTKSVAKVITAAAIGRNRRNANQSCSKSIQRRIQPTSEPCEFEEAQPTHAATLYGDRRDGFCISDQVHTGPKPRCIDQFSNRP